MVDDAVLAWLRTHHDRILARLVEFASIPSVSTDPAHAADIDRAARWVAAEVTAAGPFTVRTMPTAGNPVVYGEWLGAPGKPTVLVYGHYDVQPPDPLEKWQSPPWTPTVRDGRLHARGVSDDKGPMLIPIAVAEAFFAAGGGPPVNLKFLFEGEEEVGSRHLDRFVAENRELLAADRIMRGWSRRGSPRLSCGSPAQTTEMTEEKAMALFGKPMEIPSARDALPGRSQRMRVAAAHFVTGQPLDAPFEGQDRQKR